MTVRSLNAPQRAAKRRGSRRRWPAPREAGRTASPRRRLPAAAAKKKKDDEDFREHGPVPATDCSCGIYATTDLDVINGYLSRSAPVLGIVELGGRMIPPPRATGPRTRGSP